MSHYDTLKVDKSAPIEEIRSSFRKRAMKLHPDRGGNTQEFMELQKAYATLSDPDNRAYYDETGKSEREVGPNPYEVIAQVFDQLLSHSNVKTTNLVQKVKDHFNTQKMNISSIQLLQANEKYREVMRRTSSPVLVDVVRNKRIMNIQQYLNLRRTRKLIDQCLQVMEGWTYRTDPESPSRHTYYNNLWSSNAR